MLATSWDIIKVWEKTLHSHCVPVSVHFPLAMGASLPCLNSLTTATSNFLLGSWGRVSNSATTEGQTDRNLGLGIYAHSFTWIICLLLLAASLILGSSDTSLMLLDFVGSAGTQNDTTNPNYFAQNWIFEGLAVAIIEHYSIDLLNPQGHTTLS